MQLTKNKILEISIKKKLNLEFIGSYKTAFRGVGLEFSELREYFIGDSVKNIDWKTSAKHNKLYIKKYSEERDLKILFFIDIGENMFFGSKDKIKLDLSKEIILSLGLSAIKSGDSIGAILYNEKINKFIEFKKGEQNLFKILDEMDKVKEKKESNTINSLKNLYKLNLKNCLIFILSDNLIFDKHIFRLLNTENELIYINIFDYFENNLIENTTVLNLGGLKNFLNINFGNTKKIEEYKKIRENKINKFKVKLKQNNIDYLFLDTEKDLFKELFIFFKNRTKKIFI